ncbi:MAG: exopolysaccharide biosynthesis polyprenyl glycosylphosphotransferase [Anaerolineae bacterium]|nr:exopolysaccharide biosynthesis polyprenyl glycosylphosphotransferase [Anaerolineae bacterium]NIO00306.1 exopolysaccharide biosynthesis polyprenyl glycosylphosphotransferase [Anaerolineae bacterium]NIQ83084.1 exopolysaccharide biosynthesis polyprenyl glycosylphosphotransferase [Anaerolineae bacterium]
MVKRSSTNYAVMLLLLDLCFTQLALYLASVARRYLPFGLELGRAKTAYLPFGIYVIVGVLWMVIFTLLSVYDLRKNLRLVDQLQRVLVATTVATLVFAGALYLSFRDVPRLLFVYFFFFDLLSLVGLRLLMRLAFVLTAGNAQITTRVLIVGAGTVGREVARTIEELEWPGLRAIGYLDDDPNKKSTKTEGLPVLGMLSDAFQVVQDENIDEVILALPLGAHRKMVGLVTDLQKLPVDVKVVPDFFDLALHHASIDLLGGMPLIGLRDPAIDGFQRLVKRVFDLLVATPLIVLLSPLMLVLAILIKLDSKGPAIFKQRRVGENYKTFPMYKFRSMVECAEARFDEVAVQTADGQILHKFKDDPRVTRLGRILRRTSIDELPQLFNVLRGEMSLVGPRPELPFLVERYEPWQRKRFAVPPGMTGWWQISGRSDRPMHLHIQHDLYYIQNYSPLLDLQILWKTVGAVLKGRGAY